MQLSRLTKFLWSYSESPATPSQPTSNPYQVQYEILSSDEERWCRHLRHLRTHNLELPSRFRSGWVPSWRGTDKDPDDCDDGPRSPYETDAIDLTRSGSAAMVYLHHAFLSFTQKHVKIVEYLNSPELRNKPENHTVHLIRDTLYPQVDIAILVTPLLRNYNDPPFDTIGEVVEFFKQAFEGLKFMHDHDIAYGSSAMEVKMDPIPLFPEMFHPNVQHKSRDLSGPARHTTRTSRPTTYYFTNFRHSQRYPKTEERLATSVLMDWAPEFGYYSKYDPFPADVYFLGRKIRKDILKELAGFEFMEPLVSDMMKTDPKSRPTMEDVVARFQVIRHGLSSSILRSTVVTRADGTRPSTSLITIHPSLLTTQTAKSELEGPDPIPGQWISHPTPIPDPLALGDMGLDLDQPDIIKNDAESPEQRLQVLQEMLDRGRSVMSKDSWYSLLRDLLRLCRESKALPLSYYLSGVVCNDRSPSGSGSFGDVYIASWNRKQVALKLFRTFVTRESPFHAAFLREITIWRQLNHPSIQPFLGVDRVSFAPRMAIVSNWLLHGNINQAIHALDGRGEPVPHMQWILQITEGLTYLHNERIVHGDVKGANILIDDTSHVRLIDFGLTSLADAQTQTMGSRHGFTTRWASPELLEDVELKGPDPACDTYAFACTCVEIYSRQRPFNNIASDLHVISRVTRFDERPSRPVSGIQNAQSMPDRLWDIVERCWRRNAVERPGMSSVAVEVKLLVTSES